jgi:uncharacterized protein (DUF58 family)
VTPRPTHRVVGYALVVILGLAGALVTGRPEAAVLAAPFALYLALGFALGRPSSLDVTFRVDRDRVVEGDRVHLTVSSDVTGIELVPLLAAPVTIAEADATAGRHRFTLAFERWGAFHVGTFAVRAFDPLRLWSAASVVSAPVSVRVHPTTDRLRRAITPAALQRFVGQHTSRRRGDGFEFAELRPYRHGDRSSSISWRATARRGSLWVNDRHPDRSGAVVLLVDTFGTESRDRVELLDAAVRSLAALAEAYERTHDRVGLLTFGGHLRWLRPGGGRTNLVRIVDAMLDADRLLTETWEGVLRVPAGAIPPNALLVAVTSLDSDTSIHTLLDLRARGFDVCVLTVEPHATGAPSAQLLDRLLREARALRLQRFGVAVASLDDGLAAAVEEVAAWRRRVPRLHA